MSQTVLVTGGLGYIGGRLSQHLSGHGFRVMVGTRNPSQTPPSWLCSGKLIRVDLTDEASLADAVQGVDHVIHLAAVNENEAARDPELALRINTLGTLKLVRAAASAKVDRFIFFSTAHVYGAPLQGNLMEDLPTRPVHPYAYTHRAAEDIVFAAKGQGIATPVVIRLSNGFGAPERLEVDRWTLLVNDLCRQVVDHKTLTLKSSGMQLRDFVTLHDVARATEHLLRLETAKLGDGLFNVGGAKSETVLAMTKRIARCYEELFAEKPVIIRPEPSPSEKTSTSLSFSIEKLLHSGFQPTGNADAEIRDTLRMCAASRHI